MSTAPKPHAIGPGKVHELHAMGVCHRHLLLEMTSKPDCFQCWTRLDVPFIGEVRNRMTISVRRRMTDETYFRWGLTGGAAIDKGADARVAECRGRRRFVRPAANAAPAALTGHSSSWSQSTRTANGRSSARLPIITEWKLQWPSRTASQLHFCPDDATADSRLTLAATGVAPKLDLIVDEVQSIQSPMAN